MRKGSLVALSLVLLVAPATASAEPIASGHIELGTPHTGLLTLSEADVAENVDSFFFDAPAAGTRITTRTLDRGELGYDLDFYFWDANGGYVDSDCQTEAEDESCTVPAGAVDGEVAAFFGRDLDVEVLTVP